MDACSHALKEHLEKYLVEKPNQTLRSVALRAGVPYSNLWRVTQNGTKVDFGTAISVMNAVAPASVVGEFLKTHFPEKAKIANGIYAAHREGLPSNLFREHLGEYVPNQVFSLAATRAGTTRQRIESLYGEKGRAALNELIESEILTQDPDGSVKFPQGNYSISNPTDFVANFTRKMEGFDKSLMGTNGAVLASITDSVNEESLSKIKSILVEAYRKINDLVTSKESEGTLPVFAGMAMTLLDGTDFDSGRKGDAK